MATLKKSSNPSLTSKLYTATFCLLALVAVAFSVLDMIGTIDLLSTPFRQIDTLILLIFTVDYAVRFFIAKEKKKFFRENILDLLAIIPFSSAFRLFRVAKTLKLLKLFRLFRTGAFLGVLWKKSWGILKTNGFIYILCVNSVLILCASFVMMYAESMTFADALWWSIVTCTTVGYGDISPSTTIGRIVAIILMVFGIGLLGMLTGSITTYFTQDRATQHQNGNSNDEISSLLDRATDEEKEKILEIAKIVIKK